jgi:NodT family efflux transporter outer membrane factor (OMF) lipoprotein
MSRLIARAAVMLSTFAVTACVSLAPDHSPAASITPPASFREAQDALMSSDPVSAQWWRLFDEPALDALVERALAANTDLRAAVANLEVSRASLQLAKSAQLPATVLESGAGPERADRQPSTSSVNKTSYEFAATLAYEIDLFGRLRSASHAAREDLESSTAMRDAVRLAVVSDTVAAYIDYCSAVATSALSRDLVLTQERSADLVTKQLDEGEISQLELAQAGAALERARATVPPLEADRRRALYRLTSLQGMPPALADSNRPACAGVPRMTRPLPVGDGTDLLARRPDVREAEHRLKAATARIGVATADLYPRVQIGGSGGRIAGGWEAFLTPLVTWSFPNQSAARARLSSARASEAAALANFDGTILRALREVESTLADYQAEYARSASLEAALAQSERARRRAAARFRLGADSYLLVLDADRTHADLTLLKATSEARLAQIQVLLFRALGGGWQGIDSVDARPAASD